ncbi:hypothetical protein GF325_11665 [Candidatus Bathyarchaeota archaeon]|nr:hypothetical protein [Candidatus Bathyarchaeota archaeon]
MKKCKYKMGAIAFLAIPFLLLLPTSRVLGFSDEPQLLDAHGDTGLDYEDMRDIWIDNNNTHLMFKVDLGGAWNETLSFQCIYMSILTEEGGTNTAFFDTWNTTYLLGITANGTHIRPVFYDKNDPSNSLSEAPQCYWKRSNANQTVEIGYELKKSVGGKGLLDLEAGDAIDIRFYSGGDSDVAPEDVADSYSYTLKSPTKNIPGYSMLLLMGSIFFTTGMVIIRFKQE